ncbi:hypothetical protein INR49_009349 [Caranx melampygus]|nr:hypothetical protein INR49_009349 [Caranx melampygus]
MISSIKAMKILKRVGGTKGTWSKDASRGSGKVYVFNGTDDDTVYEFSSVQEFTRSLGMSQSKSLTLPSSWSGTGQVVLNGHAYYVNQADEVMVVKYDLKSKSVMDSAVFPVQDHIPVYGLNPETVMDLAVDEEGLWAIYATRQNERHISVAKMDASSWTLSRCGTQTVPERTPRRPSSSVGLCTWFTTPSSPDAHECSACLTSTTWCPTKTCRWFTSRNATAPTPASSTTPRSSCSTPGTTATRSSTSSS